MRCDECKSYHPDTHDSTCNRGTCRKKSPIVLRSGKLGSQTVWPRVKVFECCGEFEGKH